MLFGDALFNNDTLNRILTISGLERLIIENRVKFNDDVVIDGNLTLGPDASNTILNQNKWVLNTNNLIQTFDNDGHLLKQKSGSKEPRSRWENTDGTQWTEITPGNVHIKGSNAGITLENPNGVKRNIYIDNSGKVIVDGNMYVDGDIITKPGSKVWGSCYN